MLVLKSERGTVEGLCCFESENFHKNILLEGF